MRAHYTVQYIIGGLFAPPLNREVCVLYSYMWKSPSLKELRNKTLRSPNRGGRACWCPFKKEGFVDPCCKRKGLCALAVEGRVVYLAAEGRVFVPLL